MFTTTRGNSRQNLFQRLWNLIRGITRRSDYQGSMRPTSKRLQSLGTRGQREYDLEVSEYPVRDAVRARELIELREYCPEVATAIDWIRDDVPSSVDGDDHGFAIPDTDRYDNPIDDRVLGIARDCAERVWNPSTLEMAVDRLVSYGDFFAEQDIQLRGNRQINGLMFLPTWEMFRVQPQSQLERFEQRKYLTDNTPIEFLPLKIIHGRYRRNHLYGRSLFHESLDDWAKLRAATQDLANAARQTGTNPFLHLMPEGADREYKESYKDDHEMAMADGSISHYYLMPGHEIRQVSNIYPNLSALAEAVLLWRSRIIMKSGVPPYLLGLPAQGAKEIAGQPALAYARRINRIRQTLSECIRQTINTELALNQIDRGLWNYRVKWPRIAVNMYQDRELNLAEDPDIADTDSLGREIFASHVGYSKFER